MIGATISAQPNYNFPPVNLGYAPTQFRARVVSVLLVISALLSFASIFTEASGFVWPGGLLGDDSPHDALKLVLALLTIGFGLIQFVVFVATVVFFLVWLYRAHENLMAFGVKGNSLEYSSGWAVGSFFVPFVSLVVPYRAIKELWTKSVPNSASLFSQLSPPGFFPLWWGMWLLSNFVDQLYFRLTWQDKISRASGALLGVIGGVLGVVAAVLAIMVVREIERQQTETSRQIPVASPHAQLPDPPLFDSPSTDAR
ncbi:MAG: DUF4328 domain-containing protein [bacterium]